MKSQKVIFIMPSIKIGGGNRAILSLIKKFYNEGHECHLYYIESSKKCFELFSDLNCTSIKLKKETLLHKLFGFFKLSLLVRKQEKKGLLILSDPILCIFRFLYPKLKAYRFVQGDDRNLFNENVYGNYFFNLIFKYLFNLSKSYSYEAIIFNSEFSKNAFFNFKSIKRDYKIVHPPVFPNKIKKITRKPELKFVTVSNSHPRKGLELFIKIAESELFTDSSFTVISQDNLDLPKNIKQVKPIDDDEYFKALDNNSFYISTSSFEGFGLPPLEAMSLGLVIFAIKNEGILTFSNDKNVVFFNRNDFVDLRYKIDEMMNCDYHSFSSHSIQTSKIFSEETFQDNFYNFIRNS